MGWRYDEGEAGVRDCGKAGEWYEKAAARGDVGVQIWLGSMYVNGRRSYVGRGRGWSEDVPQDLVRAHLWLSLAAARGSKTARRKLNEVIMKMTPAQVAEAQKLAQEWERKMP